MTNQCQPPSIKKGAVVRELTNLRDNPDKFKEAELKLEYEVATRETELKNWLKKTTRIGRSLKSFYLEINSIESLPWGSPRQPLLLIITIHSNDNLCSCLCPNGQRPEGLIKGKSGTICDQRQEWQYSISSQLFLNDEINKSFIFAYLPILLLPLLSQLA